MDRGLLVGVRSRDEAGRFLDEDVIARFLALTTITEGCWEWQGWRNPKGYACFRFDGRDQPVIRFACQFTWGLAPDEEADHLCRNVACVNPWHLEPVSQRENNLRSNSPIGINARKTHCIRGHLLAGKNLRRRWIKGYPGRQCWTCHNAQTAAAKKRRRENPVS